MWSRRNSPSGGGGDILVLSVEGMHCGSCGLTIDDAVEDVPGVARATTSFRSGLTEVVLDPGAAASKVGPDVVAAVAAAGYGAALRPASP